MRFGFLARAGALALVASAPALVLLAPVPAVAQSEAGMFADPDVLALMRLINARRDRIGCRALRWNEPLARLARQHSADMVRRHFFAHDNPDRQSPFDRMERAGIVYRAAAENIAAGQTTADQVFRDWMKSRGHRINMENRRYTDLGIGRVDDRWTLDLIQVRSASRPRNRVRQVGHHAPPTHRRAP